MRGSGRGCGGGPSPARRGASLIGAFGVVGLAALEAGIGLTVALFSTRRLGQALFAVSATDPATLVGVTVLLLAAALLASWLPARRAAKTDPLEVMRAG